MNPLGVDPSKPYIYVTVTGLWPDSDLVVYFLAPPPLGQAEPVATEAVTIGNDGLQNQGITLPTQPAAGGSLDFTCTGLRFAVVTEAEQTGTVQIDLRLEQDKPQQPPWDAWPIKATLNLTRAAATDPLDVTQDVAINKAAP